jgi:UDPglucose--hexose-1-phosphate uridylyltransferase
MLVDYAELESKEKTRTVFENESFWAGVPYWAVWPFEIMVVPKQHKRSLVDFTKDERAQLAECIAEITRRYDNLFETQFPYSKSTTVGLATQWLTKSRHGSSPGSSQWHS